jgi:hypothetical protein
MIARLTARIRVTLAMHAELARRAELPSLDFLR